MREIKRKDVINDCSLRSRKMEKEHAVVGEGIYRRWCQASQTEIRTHLGIPGERREAMEGKNGGLS